MQEAFLTLSFMLLLILCCFLSAFLVVENFKNALSICTDPYPSGLWTPWSLQPRLPPVLMSPTTSLALLTIRSSFATLSGRAVYYLAEEDTHTEYQEFSELSTAFCAAFPSDVGVVEVPSRMRACECDAYCSWNKKVSSIASPWIHSESRKLRN